MRASNEQVAPLSLLFGAKDCRSRAVPISRTESGTRRFRSRRPLYVYGKACGFQKTISTARWGQSFTSDSRMPVAYDRLGLRYGPPTVCCVVECA